MADLLLYLYGFIWGDESDVAKHGGRLEEKPETARIY